MNRFESISKPLKWFIALLLVAFVAGCGSGGGGAAAPSSAKAITAFSLAWTTGTPGTATGTINETYKTIAVTVPFGTSVMAMKATFTSTGASVSVAGVTQVSGAGGTSNNFTSSVAYKVTAADATYATYTVIVTVASNSTKAITAFSLAAVSGVPASIGTVITEGTTAKSIVVTMPFGTNLTVPFVATFTTSGANVVKVGGVAQVSGSGGTSNTFPTSPLFLTYTVIAANGTTADYNVTVIAALNSAKAITSFSLAAASGVPASIGTVITEGTTPKTIAVTMPNGTTDLTALVATFTAPGASVKVGGAVQTSGTTQNNFSAASGVSAVPVAYVVTAADFSTATYNVTVAAAAGSNVCTGTTGTTGNNCVNLGTAANYVILAESAITNVPTSNVTGDIGLFPTTGTAIGITCAEVTGVVYSADAAGPACKVTDGTGLNVAVNAKLAAYNDGFARVETAPANLNVGAGTLNATTVPSGLAPGAYVWTSAVSIPTDLTLVGTGAATDVWVFKVGGTLDVGANIIPSGGALPQNVFWVTSGAVTVAAGKHMEGVVLSAGDITLITGASASGRLLSATQVVLQSAIVTKP